MKDLSSKLNKKVLKKKLSYVSLFSSAGIGCYGFKENDYECITTAELHPKRMEIQKINHKCNFDDQYVVGDITQIENENKIIENIKKYSDNSLDVLIATPPCQGMSVANQKKTSKDLNRNSLVVKAIEIINKVKPKIFIFENVRAFLTTYCLGGDNVLRPIKDEIDRVLSEEYLFESKVINFKDYGSNSSRTRTLVIGINKKYLEKITPYELFPKKQIPKSLRDVVGGFKSLKEMDEYDSDNVLHHFKKYSEHMLDWIKDLKEGESAMDNPNELLRPHRIIDGKIVYNKKQFGDKWKRQVWDKPAQCIHTANDCLASQNTIHPIDNRTFSIAELMELMTIPKTFKWSNIDINSLSHKEKLDWLHKNESNIRKCIGEAVPTAIFSQIAKNIKDAFEDEFYNESFNYEDNHRNKKEMGAYYTSKHHLSLIYKKLPSFSVNSEIKILEPSVGYGNFLPLLFYKYQDIKKVTLFINDIDNEVLNHCLENIKKMYVPNNFEIISTNLDFLKYEVQDFDLIIGNPPFTVDKDKNLDLVNEFWNKSIPISKNIVFINPKYVLMSDKYEITRKNIEERISSIVDFGEIGFKNAKIETVCFSLNEKKTQNVEIISIPLNIKTLQNKKYITETPLDYWIIYRNEFFDNIRNQMYTDIFDLYKTYEISNSNTTNFPIDNNSIWLLRSKNLDFFENKLNHKSNYDRYISKEKILNNKIYKLINENKNDSFFLLPNLTYYPRIIKLPADVFFNGSLILLKRNDNYKEIVVTQKHLDFFYTDEFRKYYRIAFNYSTRTLNINKKTIKIFGVKNEIK